MITRFAFLILTITFSHFINGATPVAEVRVDIADEPQVSSRASNLNIERSSFSGSEDSLTTSFRAELHQCPASRASTLNSEDSIAIARRTGINARIVSQAHELLSANFMKNLKDLLYYKDFFRKAGNYNEGFANILLPIGVGLETISSIFCLINADGIGNTILFTGAACVVAGGAFLGFARYAAREQRERELLLKRLGEKVGFSIVTLPNTISSGDDEAENASPGDHGGPISALSQL